MPEHLVYPLALLRNLAGAPALEQFPPEQRAAVLRLREQTLVEMVDYFTDHLIRRGYPKAALLDALQAYIDAQR